MPSVVASYANSDWERVRPILEALEGAGVTVRDLADSDQLESALDTVNGAILFISHSYLTSIFAVSEQESLRRIEAVLSRFPRKPVLLVRLEESAPRPSLPYRRAPEFLARLLPPSELADMVLDVFSHGNILAPAPEPAAGSRERMARSSKWKLLGERLFGRGTAATPDKADTGTPTQGTGDGTAPPKSREVAVPPQQGRAAAPPPPPPPDEAPEEAVPVVLGASAPKEVKVGREFVANFLAYVPELEETVRKIVESQSRQATMVGGLAQCLWKKGLPVKVTASAAGLSVDPPEDEFEWNGGYQILPFDVTVPEEAKEGPVLLKFEVYAAGLRVLRLRVELTVTREVQSAERTSAVGKPACTAFASYASQDRERIADRLAALRIHDAGLDIFMDHLSLIPGEDWQERLRKEITDRELFLLFWSPDAAKSKWVDWEWRTAYALEGDKGVPDFEIHPLENGLTPPKELSHLHFGDVFMTIRAASAGKKGGTP